MTDHDMIINLGQYNAPELCDIKIAVNQGPTWKTAKWQWQIGEQKPDGTIVYERW